MSDAVQLLTGDQIVGHSLNPRQEYKIKVYDFKRPDKFALEQIRTIQFIHEAFAQLAGAVLTGMARTSVSVRLQTVDQETYVEFIRALPNPTTMGVVKLDPLRGAAILEVDPLITAAMVNRVLGGTAPSPESGAGGELSAIDEMVMESVYARVLTCLRSAWENVIDLNPRLESIDSKPEHAHIVPPSEMVITATMEVTIGAVTGTVRFCVPFITIEPIIEKLSPQYWYSSVRRAGHGAHGPIPAELLRADAEIATRTLPLTLAQLSGIAAGEPVELPALAHGRASLYVGGELLAELAVDPVQTSGQTLSVPVVSAEPPDGSGRRGGNGGNAVQDGIERLHREIVQLRHDVRVMADNQRALSDEYVAQEMDAGEGSPSGLLGSDARTVSPAFAPHLATVLQPERDHAVAFCLSLLAPETAAGVLADVEPSRRASVVRALAQLEEVEEQFRVRIGAYLVRAANARERATRSGGYDAVAEVLNHVPRSVEKSVMEQFMAEEKPLFEEIAKRMFVFEDFVLVDAQAIRKLAARVSVEEMAPAMKDVQADVASHILNALDEDTAAALQAAIDATGRVRRRDVEAAQRELIEELRVLEESGEIVVGRPDEVID